MNGAFDRKLIAEIIVLLAIVGGAWVLIVRPKTTQFQVLQETIATAQSDPVRQRHAAISRMASQLDAVRERVNQVDHLSAYGRNSSQMYGLIMDLAKSHGVTVQALDPAPTRPALGEMLPVEVARFDMRVDGHYRDVAAFLRGLGSIEGFVRPGSLGLTPRGSVSAAVVDAQFSCEVLSFNLPDALAGMVESSDVDG